MPALSYALPAGTAVWVNHPMPYGGSSEVWEIVSSDDCHYYLTAKYTAGRVVRVRFDSVREVPNGTGEVGEAGQSRS